MGLEKVDKTARKRVVHDIGLTAVELARLNDELTVFDRILGIVCKLKIFEIFHEEFVYDKFRKALQGLLRCREISEYEPYVAFKKSLCLVYGKGKQIILRRQEILQIQTQ